MVVGNMIKRYKKTKKGSQSTSAINYKKARYRNQLGINNQRNHNEISLAGCAVAITKNE